MILIDDVKYACMECIRGHRSSLCRHHQRPLLQVRSKGRPNFGLGNKNHRIAVFAEEIAENLPSDDSGPCKGLPVVILKASDKQIIDLLNGRIVGPYKDTNAKAQSAPLISSESFINSTSCCLRPASKVTKSCSCNKKEVPKSKILKTYLGKRQHLPHSINIQQGRQNLQQPQSSCCGPKKETFDDHLLRGLESIFPERREEHPNNNSFNNGFSNVLYNTADGQSSGSSISSNGSLSYQSNGSTQTSSTPSFDPLYGKEAAQNGFKDMPKSFDIPLDYAPQAPHMIQNSYHYPQNQSHLLTTQGNKREVFEMVNVQPCSILGSCACASDCACPGCEEHKNQDSGTHLGNLRNDSQYDSTLILSLNDPQLQLPAPALFPPENPSDHYVNFLQQIIRLCSDAREEGVSDFPVKQDEAAACQCDDDACECTNCETHGIIEGLKLDDVFKTQTSQLPGQL